MARKGWESLSPGYRARLERNGVSKTAYGRGESIRAARGHAQTPEHPKEVTFKGGATQFPHYKAERDRLTKRIGELKQYWFGDSPKWNPKRSKEKFRKEPPSIVRMRQWVKLSREEWIDAIREDPTAASYLGYH